jgi:hypothetical protein
MSSDPSADAGEPHGPSDPIQPADPAAGSVRTHALGPGAPSSSESPSSESPSLESPPASESPEARANRLEAWRRRAARARSTTRRASSVLGQAGRTGAGRVQALTEAQGMGESGLSRLFALHAFNAGGDAAMAVGLAGTLFFQVPSGEARGRVALYLLLTMAPFVLVAPLLGPFLDRFRHGRRWAIGSTMAARAFFCWVLAGAVVTGSTWLYPVAFGCLVASKAYGLARAASVPRLLPAQIALVTANSRISLAGVVGAAVSGGIAALLSRVGADWSLRWAFLVFLAATILAIRLPARIDSSVGEVGGSLLPGFLGKNRRRLPMRVTQALQINTGIRAFAGFLLMFLAFMLRERPFPGISHTLMFALVGAAAGAGSLTGTGLGALLKARPPALVVRAVLGLAIVGALTVAVFFSPWLIVAVAFVASLCQQLAKLSLDALIQGEIEENWRTNVFARSETLLQTGWVLGGVFGIVLPLWPWLGFGGAALWLAAIAGWQVSDGRRTRHRVVATATSS